MLIHNISLTNFLCYYGSSNFINFNNGLNLILGSNGYGKSKLYDAFQWVFKDGIADENDPTKINKTENVKRSLLSDRALSETAIGDSVYCEVVLEVARSEESIFQIKRKYNIKRKSEKDWIEPTISELKIYKKSVIRFEPVDEDYYDDIINSIIRPEIMPYVWFQGERGINNIIDVSNSRSLKKVIQQLSDIRKWDSYIDIADKLANTTRREYEAAIKSSNRYNEEKKSLIENRENIITDLDSIKEEYENVKNNLDSAKEKQSSIIGKLKSAQAIENLTIELKNNEKDYKSIIDQIDSFYMNFTRKIFTKQWLLIHTDYLVNLFEDKYNHYLDFIKNRIIENALLEQNQSRLPRGVPERVHLQNMLNQEMCLICNRTAKKGSTAYESIKELLNENITIMKQNDIEPEVRNLINKMVNIQEKYKNTDNEINEELTNLDKLKEKKEEIKKNIELLNNNISNEIMNSGVTQSIDIISSYESSTDDIVYYSKEIEKLQSKKDNLEDKLHTIKRSLTQLVSDEVSKKLEKKYELTEDLKELTIRVKEFQYTELIDLLENKVNEHYENINKPTGAFYGKIKFVRSSSDSSSGVTPIIIDDNGNKVKNLNTSQITSFKLAMIMSIVTANEKRGYSKMYPLISDAPISDFDSIKSKSFLEEVAKTFNQSIIIVKDYLVEGENKKYLLDKERLSELKEALEKENKNLSIIHLDLPEGISVTNREKLSVIIKSVEIT